MSILKIATSAVMALSLVAVPTLVQAAPASSKLAVSGSVARSSAHVGKSNKAISGSIVIALLAAAAVVAGIVIAADNNNNPTSG